MWLEAATGFDSPNVRQNINDLPEYDGAVAGDAYFSSRPITLSGKIAASSAAQRNNTVVKMQQALRGLRGDVTIKSQPQGLPAMQVTARLDNFRFSGGFVKDFQIALTCPDPRIYSQTVNTTSVFAIPSVAGASFPWIFPVSWGGGSGAAATTNVVNAGNFSTPPTIRLWGPMQDPQITNAATLESVFLDGLTLNSGDYVDLDFNKRTAVKNDGTNLYSSVRFPGSSWFLLVPGTNPIQLFAAGTTSLSEVSVTYRDAWA